MAQKECTSVRYIRLNIIEANHRGHYVLTLCGFEIFGALFFDQDRNSRLIYQPIALL